MTRERARRIVVEHELANDPTTFANILLLGWAERIAPELPVGAARHLVPIAVEIPLTGRWKSSPVPPGLERR